MIIGPLAWEEAGKVTGLKVIDKSSGSVTLEGSDTRSVIDNLVKIYELFFGRASHEVCREAARPFLSKLSPAEIPLSLQ